MKQNKTKQPSGVYLTKKQVEKLSSHAIVSATLGKDGKWVFHNQPKTTVQ